MFWQEIAWVVGKKPTNVAKWDEIVGLLKRNFDGKVAKENCLLKLWFMRE